MRKNSTNRTWLSFFCGLGICLLGICGLDFQAALGSELIPLAPVPESGPYTRQYQTHQLRRHEAETKARLLEKKLTGDPAKTANMQLYDVTYYGLDLDLDPSAEILTGHTIIQANVTGTSLPTMDLHLRGSMAVASVTSGGVATGFSRSGDVLSITLDRQYQAGEQVTLAVSYSGNPQGEYFGWSSYGGQPLIWSLSEPYGARHWWPCKDLNTDKADSVDLRVTVPENLIVASNGTLQSVEIPSPGKKLYHWHEQYPIATYLVSLAIHPYETFTDAYVGLDGQTMPLEFYVVPGSLGQATSAFAVTVPMLEAFAPAFGEYPFINEKYGHAHFPWGGGMEHQTLTSLHYSVYSEGIIAHELGHQWWGDMITCADFGHIWLNEGFATWSEAYWREVNEGLEAYHQEMGAARYVGPGTIYVEDQSSVNAIFNYNLSYLKASWVPHMLRGVLGDDDFFAGLAHYRQLYEDGSATTEQFRDAMEDVSGQDLDAFFQQWIYGAFYPRYQFNYSFSPQPGGQRLDLKIEQVQTNAGVFTMPIDVRVYSSGGSYVDFQVQCDRREQWYALDVPGDAIFVEIDPDDWILCDKFSGGSSGTPDTPAPVARLVGNHPNPFNPATTISYEVGQAGRVKLAVYDVSGRLIRTLADGWRDKGSHEVRWDGRHADGTAAASGLYFARLLSGGQQSTHKLTLVQ